MNKAVLISIRPEWCELIANGKKTIEVRKTKPKLETPFKCYIYCTKAKNKASVDGYTFFADELYIDHCSKTLTCGHTQFEEIVNGKVIGEFVCDEIRTEWEVADGLVDIVLEMQSCVDCSALIEYSGGKELHSWNISNLKIYDEPKELSEFCTTDNEAVRKCEHRFCGGQPEYKTNNGGWIKGSYMCTKESDYDPDWCEKCKTKPIIRPPQSWCYVEEV